VRRAAARHGGRGKPTMTHSPERSRRRRPTRWSRERLGPVALLWARRQCSAPVDLRAKEDGRGGRHGEMMAARRALTDEDGGDRNGQNASVFKDARCWAMGRHVALGVQRPPTGGPGQRSQPLTGGPAPI
jgi:hypothetical protein